ncbi:hypothetical protein L0F63_000728 [Massospora cicadina]|nr:hypothetical protein L0F63_000728 [Massospora cicadina]
MGVRRPRWRRIGGLAGKGRRPSVRASPGMASQRGVAIQLAPPTVKHRHASVKAKDANGMGGERRRSERRRPRSGSRALGGKRGP